MTKAKTSAILVSVILFFSLASFTVTSVATPLQVRKLMTKPSWAGSPGGPNGGDNGDDPTTYMLHIEIDYMNGHEPTQFILDYIVNYYDA